MRIGWRDWMAEWLTGGRWKLNPKNTKDTSFRNPIQPKYDTESPYSIPTLGRPVPKDSHLVVVQIQTNTLRVGASIPKYDT